jgi:hypothetical protein
VTSKADGVLITQRPSGIIFQHGDETFTLLEFVQRFMQYDMEVDLLAQEIDATRAELEKRYRDIADDNLSTFAAYIACGYAPDVEGWQPHEDADEVRESFAE